MIDVVKAEKHNGMVVSPFNIITAFICLSIVGACLIPKFNFQLEPWRSSKQINVTFGWAGASARVIEQEVTAKLEGRLSVIKGIEDISSESRKGTGTINLVFKESVNIDAVRFEIASLIRQSYNELPQQVTYPEITINESANNIKPLITYSLNAHATPSTIQEYAEEYLVPMLSRAKDIDRVYVYGGSEYAWEISFKVEVINALGIHGFQIVEAVNNFFSKRFIGKGFTETDQGQESILILKGHSSDSLDWKEVPIGKYHDRIIHLTDIASIRYKEQSPNSYFRNNGLNTVNIVIYPKRDVNTIALASVVRDEVDKMDGSLRPGYQLLLTYDTTQYLLNDLKKILWCAIFSIVILLLFIWIIRRELKFLLLILIGLIATLLISPILIYGLRVDIHLYSLSGITISLGLIIGNSLMIVYEILNDRRTKVISAIIATNLATVSALTVIFFLSEEQRQNLADLALIIVINLVVSLAVAFVLIPTLVKEFKLSPVQKSYRYRRVMLKIYGHYQFFILFGRKRKYIFILIALLGFGIPVYWLPAQLSEENLWAEEYNSTIGHGWFRDTIRPTLELLVGGALRLFEKSVFEKSVYLEPTQTVLKIECGMPEGCSVQQVNETIQKMENYIAQFSEVALFQTAVYNSQFASISVYFKDQFEIGNFPYFLKKQLESKALGIGGADWSITGVGQGFSNAIFQARKSERIILEGYNYDFLYQLSLALKERLRENPRIKEVEIKAYNNNWFRTTSDEFYVKIDNESLVLRNVTIRDFYSALQDKTYHALVPPIFINGRMEDVFLRSDSSANFKLWNFKNEPIALPKTREFKVSSMAVIDRVHSENEINRNNQQYRIMVAYDFIGPDELALLSKELHVEELKASIPLGYSAWYEKDKFWNKKDPTQYYLIFLIIFCHYFIFSILFESFRQPVSIIVMIPLSLIGVLLSFYLVRVNFDQGGFASFLLIAGLVVYGGVYLVNDVNRNYRSSVPFVRRYIKSFNRKIVPITLSVVATILTLIPFVLFQQNVVFWYAFAVGSIGGLIFSLIVLLIFLPLFISSKSGYGQFS